MAIDRERSKAQRENAGNAKVEGKATRLRMQWSASGNCLHHDYDSLARSVGLGSADIAQLKAWVASQGLREPRRPKPKG